MFKSANIYEYECEAIEQTLEHAFDPCGPGQVKSIGWVDPRDPENHAAKVEPVAHGLLLMALVETKSVPADVLNRHLSEKLKSIEQATGRKPGRKESKLIREELLGQLLPNAFPKRVAVPVWICPDDKTLLIGSSSQGICDDVLTLLVTSFKGMSIRLLNTATTPVNAMLHWLTSEELATDGVWLGREVELHSSDERKTVVKLSNHNLHMDSTVLQHVAQGCLPVSVAVDIGDRVSLVMTEGLTLKKIKLLDGAIADFDDTQAGDFDASAYLEVLEIKGAVDQLIKALGGRA